MQGIQKVQSLNSSVAQASILSGVSKQSSYSWVWWSAFALSICVGVWAAWWAVPLFSAPLAQSLIGAQAKGFWFLSRASGVTAYVLLWASAVLGLLMSTRLSRTPRFSAYAPVLMAVHEFVSLVAWGFVAFHAVVLLGDTYVQTDWLHLLVPFSFATEKSVWIGLGQLSLYLMAVIVLSYYVRARIGFQTWRWLHFATFTLYALVTVHALLAGSDTSVLWPMYAVSNGIVLFLTVYRLLQMRQVALS